DLFLYPGVGTVDALRAAAKAQARIGIGLPGQRVAPVRPAEFPGDALLLQEFGEEPRPAAVDVLQNQDRLHCPGAAAAAASSEPATGWPANSVRRTRASEISAGSMRKRFRSSTTISASLPVSMLPVRSSRRF